MKELNQEIIEAAKEVCKSFLAIDYEPEIDDYAQLAIGLSPSSCDGRWGVVDKTAMSSLRCLLEKLSDLEDNETGGESKTLAMHSIDRAFMSGEEKKIELSVDYADRILGLSMPSDTFYFVAQKAIEDFLESL